MRDPAALERKLASFHARNCALIMDFDNTLTQEHCEAGKRRDGCHKVLMHSSLMPDAFRAGMAELFEAGRQPTSTKEELDALFELLWRKANDLAVVHGLRREHIADMVAGSTMALRTGAGVLFETAASAGIPLLVFSAGIKQVIMECLRRDGLEINRDMILANSMVFSDDGALLRWEEPVVHVENKSLRQFPNALARLLAIDRVDKVVLLGDSIGDLSMVHGLPIDPGEDVVSIGLYNGLDTGTANACAAGTVLNPALDKYIASFDIVLVGDGSLEYAVALVDDIASKGGR